MMGHPLALQLDLNALRSLTTRANRLAETGHYYDAAHRLRDAMRLAERMAEVHGRASQEKPND